jgi:hypothetical protein
MYDVLGMRMIWAQDDMLNMATIPRDIASKIDPIKSIAAKTDALSIVTTENIKTKRLIQFEKELREFLNDFSIEVHGVSI